MPTAAPQINTPADEPVDQAIFDNEAHALTDLGHFGWENTLVQPGTGKRVKKRMAPKKYSSSRLSISSFLMVAGGATTTIYPTTMADDVAFILADSGTKVIFAENADQLDKLRGIRASTPAVTRVIVFDAEVDDNDPWTLNLDQVRQLGREYLAGDPGAIDARIDGIQHDDLATIIYTSGTTGRPKGVRLRHSAWTYEGAGVASTHILSEDDLQYLWLPLAHVFGKVLLTLPLQIGFPTAIDGRIDKIVDNLAVVKPTFMGAAPSCASRARTHRACWR